MGFHFNKTVLSVCAGIALGTRLLAAGTNAPAATDLTNIIATQNALLQIQEQLRATQLAIEENRQVAETEATNIAGQLAAMQLTIATQHASEAEAARRTQQLTLIHIVFESPKTTVAAPNIPTQHSITAPALCFTGRQTIVRLTTSAPTEGIARSRSSPRGPA